MTSFWERGNVWLTLPPTATKFSYMSWQRFSGELPFESVSWQRRGIRLLSWGTMMESNRRLLQIVFLASIPEVEWFCWEITVNDDDIPKIQAWLSERMPSYWKL